MKNIFKRVVIAISWRIVSRLRQKNDFIVIGVAGSLGKSGTKRAIATILSEKYRVQWQDGNYNDIVSVPLIFFGLTMPSLTNPFAWAHTFTRMRRQIKDFPYDTVVVELGTDGPGQIAQFKKYLTLDVGVITKISPEHIEFFGTLDEVAKEETSLQEYSGKLLVHEDVAKDFGNMLKSTYQTFGKEPRSTARFTYERDRLKIDIGKDTYSAKTSLVGEHQMWGLAGAALLAKNLGLKNQELEAGLSKVLPMPGRMQELQGIKNSKLIDDTYNANVEAMIAALDTLYGYEDSQKIAVLGNMNEMGMTAEQGHAQVGQYCDPEMLSLVITLGSDANTHLAKSAEERGCEVIRCTSPAEAGDKLKERISDGAVVLFKGSQNGVFLEEAVKLVLANPKDAHRLVRQSPEWLAKKKKMFAGD